MNLKTCVAAAAFALLPLASQASVVYQWETIENKSGRDFRFMMEFEERTVESGSFSLHLTEHDLHPREWLPRPELGLISFRLGDWLAVFNRQTGNPFGGTLDMDLTFGSHGLLSGSLRSNDNQITNFSMLGASGVFAVTYLGSDAFPYDVYGCGPNTPACIPITGTIRRIDAAEIPEPGTLALFGVGLLAASRIRRRKTL